MFIEEEKKYKQHSHLFNVKERQEINNKIVVEVMTFNINNNNNKLKEKKR